MTLGRRGIALDGLDRPAQPVIMTTNVERLAVQAMKLPGESRARLADLLVESLDAEEFGPIDRLWVAEAKRRRDEVREGRVKSISGEEARQKARRALGR